MSLSDNTTPTEGIVYAVATRGGALGHDGRPPSTPCLTTHMERHFGQQSVCSEKEVL